MSEDRRLLTGAFSPRADFGLAVASYFVGQHGPENERIHGRIHIAVMERTTGATPLSYRQSAQSGRSVEAPTRAARSGGIPIRNCDEYATRLTALGLDHRHQIAVPSTQHGLTEHFLHAAQIVAADIDLGETRYQVATHPMIAASPRIAEPLLQTPEQLTVVTASGLAEPRLRSREFPRMLDLLTSGQRGKRGEAEVDTDCAIANDWNGVGFRIGNDRAVPAARASVQPHGQDILAADAPLSFRLNVTERRDANVSSSHDDGLPKRDRRKAVAESLSMRATAQAFSEVIPRASYVLEDALQGRRVEADAHSVPSRIATQLRVCQRPSRCWMQVLAKRPIPHAGSDLEPLIHFRGLFPRRIELNGVRFHEPKHDAPPDDDSLDAALYYNPAFQFYNQC